MLFGGLDRSAHCKHGGVAPLHQPSEGLAPLGLFTKSKFSLEWR